MTFKWFRRNSVAEDALVIVTELHGYLVASFLRHGYSEAESHALADIAFEGWLNYVREQVR